MGRNDYYPFGMQMPGRKYSVANSGYRYGFNGKENDNEVKGEGNQQDYGMRPYDTRLGRLISVDPLTPQYAYLTTYQFAENSPIENIDFLGMQGSPVAEAGIPTLPTIGNFSNVVGSGISPFNRTTVNGPINSGVYAPQSRFNTQAEFESIVPPYGGATMNADGKSVTVFGANGTSWQETLIKAKASKPMTLGEALKGPSEQFKTDRINMIKLMEFKRSILTEKATPLVIKPINSYQQITTDVNNLKAQDILALKDRIAKGEANDQDRIHAAGLIRERLDYQINPKHTGQGGANASVLPSNHAELWNNKTTYVGGESDTWWSIEGTGNKAIFHQFKGDGNGTYHWAGSTNKNNVNRNGQPVKPISLNNVPASAKRKAGFGG